jgi:uncharacterized protein
MRNVGYQPAEQLTVWCVTDGRAGIENQALGLAEAIARRAPATIIKKRIAIRTPWRWLPPGFVPMARAALSQDSDVIDRPWPDVWIGCGRASVPLSMGAKDWSNGKSLIVQLQDPRVNPREFDLVVPPLHDDLEGANVIATLGALNRVTPERIATEAAKYPGLLPALPGPRFAVLIGGKSKRQSIGPKRRADIAAALQQLQRDSGGSLMVSLSRRSGPAEDWRAAFTAAGAAPALLYTGDGPNPYFAMLAAADAILVTADSVNMAAEAASTGKPVFLLPVDGASGKLASFHDALIEHGAARWFIGAFEQWDYPPLREADRIAERVLAMLAQRAKR